MNIKSIFVYFFSYSIKNISSEIYLLVIKDFHYPKLLYLNTYQINQDNPIIYFHKHSNTMTRYCQSVSNQ